MSTMMQRLWQAIRQEPSGLIFYFGLAVFATSPAWLAAIAIWLRS